MESENGPLRVLEARAQAHAVLYALGEYEELVTALAPLFLLPEGERMTNVDSAPASAPAIADKLACLKRELAMRKGLYPRWVTAGKMTAHAAAHEIRCIEAIIEDYEREGRTL